MENLDQATLDWLNSFAYAPGSYGLTENNVNLVDANGQTWHPTYTGGMSSDNTSDTTTLTGYMKDVVAGKYGVGDQQYMYDAQGNYTGMAGIPEDTSTMDLLKFAATAAAMGYGGSLLNGATVGAGAGTGSFGVLGDAATATSVGSTGTGSSFGVLGDLASATPGSVSGGGLVGPGLSVSPGSGLNLASASGAPGIQATPGAGLDLAATTGAPGFNATTAGNALLSGAGLGTGLANGSGTLLGPAATAGTYTMADGTIVPTGGTTGGVTTPTTTPGTTPGTGTTGGTTTGAGGLDLMKLLAGLSDYMGQNNASQQMLDWLKSRTAITDSMYAQGSPELMAMQQEMDRKDAAAGRNSQYGTRAVDLAARIAQIKAAQNTAMTTGIGSYMQNSLNQQAGSLTGLLAALGNSTGGSTGTSLLDLISKGISSVGGSTPSVIPDITENGNYVGGGLDAYYP